MKSAYITWSRSTSPTSCRSSHVFIFGLLCLAWLQVAESSFTCPSGCSCIVWTSSTKVQNITCTNLNLTSVPADGKQGSDVIRLELNHNSLTSIARTDFQYFSNLEYLDLSYNNITSIDSDLFANLTNLKYLSLAGNVELGFPTGVFTDSLILYLNLSHNQISSIPNAALDALTQLKAIYLNNNLLTSIRNNLFPVTVEEIDLSYNLLTYLKGNKDYFPSRISLNISHNQISTIWTNTLSSTALTNLDLSYNSLTSLQGKLLQSSQTLTYLDLSNNNLTDVSTNFLSFSPILEHIDLRNNQLDSIPTDLLQYQNQSLTIYVTGNPFVCDCPVRAYLYSIYYNIDQTLADVTSLTCTDSTGSNTFLDWPYCSDGALGSACSATHDCLTQKAECTNNICVCSQLYYDNNGTTVPGGLCRPKQALDFLCDMDEACETNHAECRAATTSSKSCVCEAGYYDNLPKYLGGSCELQVELGETCTADIMDAMCLTNNSQCVISGSSGSCQCQDAYYDNNTVTVNAGECLPKIPLYSACNATYQCAPENSACQNNVCECMASYYNFDNTGTCREIAPKPQKRPKRDVVLLKPLCKDASVEGKCDANVFYSCFHLETSVDFSHSLDTGNFTQCQEYCFNQNSRYYQVHESICLCGVESTSSCCPHVMDECNNRHYLGPGTDYVSAGIMVSYIPLLYAGVSHSFSITTNLSTIDQIRVNFDDSVTNWIINGTSFTVQHTYDRWGQFNISVSACDDSVCDVVTVPVRVQVLPENMEFWTSGHSKEDVSTNLSTQTHVTFEEGYDVEYFWSRINPDGSVAKGRSCVSGWTAYRESCMKLYTSAASQPDAETSCAADGATLVKLNFVQDKTAIPAILNVTSGQLWTGAERAGGVWTWGDNSKTFFTDSDLVNSAAGDCLVVDVSAGDITSSACTNSYNYVCRKDPVDCPFGGVHLDNDNCIVLSPTVQNYESAQANCESTYGGWLTNITSLTTQQNITKLIQDNNLQMAWFGLSDRIHEGYYTWIDFSSFDMQGTLNYKPTVTEDLYDCFVTTNDSEWMSKDCSTEMKPSICEYAVNRDRESVPVFVMGTHDVEITQGSNLEMVDSATASPFPVSTASTEVLLFPGMWFTRNGQVSSWIVHSDVPTGQTYNISLQVYRPSCSSGILIQPGCEPSRFASCASTAPTCSPTNVCSDDTYFCYYSETCKKWSESCTCNSEGMTTNPKCTTMGDMPTYELHGKVDITITAGERFFSIQNDNSISVTDFDIVGIQYESGENPVKCEDRPNHPAQDTVYRGSHTGWLGDREQLSTTGMTSESLTCFFHVNYVENVVKYLPQDIGNVNEVGQYQFSLAVLDAQTKTFTTHLLETIDEVEFISPTISVQPTSSDMFGILYLEYNQNYDLTVRVGRGTSVDAKWEYPPANRVTASLTGSCTASVSSLAPQLCNSTLIWSDTPFTSLSFTPNATGSLNITLTLINLLETNTKILVTQTEKRITGLSLALDTPSLVPFVIALNSQSTFQATVTEGTALTYQFSVDGTSQSTVNSTLTYSCTSSGSKVVKVDVSNIVSTESTSLTVDCKQPASFSSCSFLNLPYYAATTLNFTFQISCTVSNNAEVNSLWEFADRSGNDTTTTEQTTSTNHVFSYTTSFATAVSSLNLVGIVQDPFEQVRVLSTVTVYNNIPSITVDNIQTDILIGTTLDISASVPASPGNYGTVQLLIDFGDGTNISMSGSIQHTFSTEGRFYVTVYAISEADQVTNTTLVTVYQTVTGLSFTYDGPSEVGSTTAFTATVLNGNFVSYRFLSSEFDQTLTSGSFSYSFTTAGDYNVTVVAYNQLSSEETSITAVILDSDEIRLTNLTVDGQTISDCIKTNTNYNFGISVTHYDMSSLQYSFDLGNGNIISSPTSTTSTSYTSPGNFTMNITASNTVQNFAVSFTEQICVQEEVQSPVLNISSPLGFSTQNNLVTTVGVDVSAGSSLQYQWETNATITGPTDGASVILTITGEGFYHISVNVSNAVSLVPTSKVIEVIQVIEDLTIECTSCVVYGGNFYIMNNTNAELTFSMSGIATSIDWDLGDGTTLTAATSVSHTYTSVAMLTVVLNVSNAVTSVTSESIQIYVQEHLTSVSVSDHLYNWKNNIRAPSSIKNLDIRQTGVFQAQATPDNTNITYEWIFESGLAAESTSSDIGRHNYSTTGEKSCTVVAMNMFSNVTSSPFTFYVIEEIVNVSVKVGVNELSLTSNNIVSVNTSYTFDMTSPQIVPDTEEYFFIIKQGSRLDASSSNNTVSSFTHAFPSEANYTLLGRVTNSLNSQNGKSETFVIEAVRPLSDAFITAGAGEDGNITVGSTISLTADIQEGKYPQYNWYYSSAPAGASFPAQNNQQTVSLTLSTVGEYVVTVEISNSVSQTQYANYTVVVMQAVSGVTIGNDLGVTSLNALSKDTVVQFSADVTTGTGLLYSWHITRDGNTVTTGIDQTLSFTFTDQALYNVTLMVENYASSEITYLEIYSLIAVPTFVINFQNSIRVTSLQKYAAPSGVDLTFTSNISNTDFLTFDWKVDSVPEANSTQMVKQFNTPGTVSVSLTVVNLISNETVTIQVLVQHEISGFAITNCNSTYAVNTNVTFDASYLTGTDVTIQWDRQDFTDTDGLSVWGVYTNPGTYNVNVSAHNYVNTVELHCFVIIQGIIDKLNITYPGHAFVNYGIVFTVTGDNTSPATFVWTLSNGDTKTTTTPTVSFTVTTKGQYNVSVIASNDVSSSSVHDISFEVIELQCQEPSLTVSVPSDRTTLRSRTLRLAVGVSTGVCSSYTSVNKWTIFLATSCNDPLTNEYSLPSSISVNTPDLYIPKISLDYGTYCFLFESGYLDTPVKVETKFNVTVQQSSLKAVIPGGHEKTHNTGSSLAINAQDSYDPDQITPSSSFTFIWSCSHVMGTATADAVCNQVSAITTASANLTGLTLNDNDEFTISVNVTATGRLGEMTTQKLVIVQAGSPVVEISCISCAANGHNFLSSTKQVSLKGSADVATSYAWTVEQVGGSVLTLTSDMTTTGTSSKNLVLKSGHLQNSRTYKFTLTASNSAGSGYASLTLGPSSVPSGGSCTIQGNDIVPLQDKVTVSCQNWQEPDLYSGIYYQVLATNGDEDHQLYYGSKTTVSLYLSPWMGTGFAPVTVKVFIGNDHNVFVSGGSHAVTFASPALSGQTDNIDYIVDAIQTNMQSIAKENNPSHFLQYCNALIYYLNDQSENSIGTVSERLAIRKLLANSISGIPRNVYNTQALATALRQLSAYDSELSSSTVDLISMELDILTNQMQSTVQQGQDPEDVRTDSLLAAVNNIQTSLINSSNYTADATVEATLGDLNNYVLAISDNHTLATYSSESARMEAMIKNSLDLNAHLLIIQLTAMLPDEQILTMNVSGTTLIGAHVSRSNIASGFNISGVKVDIPNNVMNYTSYQGDSVFQLLIASPDNKLNFGYTGQAVNTKTVYVSLYDENGDIMTVNLNNDKMVMHLFKNSSTAYDISDNGINHSGNYNPTANASSSSGFILAGTVITTSGVTPKYNESALHLMVTVEFPPTATADDEVIATLYKNGEAYLRSSRRRRSTSGTSLTYAMPKTVTQAMMNDPNWDHRDYTFFVPQGSFLPSDVFTIRFQSTQALNISVIEYYSTCHHFDAATSTWIDRGCSSTASSIPDVVQCECDQVTDSYGGTIFVSPADISFSDLADVDFSNNPVAIITCSVIAFMYIVAVFACRRMDILDIKHISMIPLCGKDGSFKYEVTVVTGRLPAAGTTANVGIRICGEYGKSTRQHIVKDGAFKRNSMDTFIIAYDVNLGDLKKVHVWHDNSGMSPSWYLSYIIVYNLQTDRKYYFFANSWLSLDVENGSIEKELKVAGSEEMNRFGHRFSSALFNALADKHLWLSLLNRPALSRFTRVQRITCCVTLLFTFLGVSAMWYGLLKTNNSEIGFGEFGWEELILALVSNLMVFPINLGLVFLFKKSRSKPNMLDTVQKPQTAQTLEIENLCGNSQGGSFESHNTGAIPYDLDRESTIDSVPATRHGLRRSRHVTKTQRENTDDSMCMRPVVSVTSNSAKNPMWTEDNILKWPECIPYDNDSRPSTSSTVAAGSSGHHQAPKAGGSNTGAGRRKKADPDQLLEDLDKMEHDLKLSESRSLKSSGSKRSAHSVRKQSTKTTWEELEDILHSDDESVSGSTRRHSKRGSTVSQSSLRRFNPRADPKINNGSRWPQARHSIMSASTGIGETFDPATNQELTGGLQPGYYSEMTMESRDQPPIHHHKEKCSLPPWCVYIAYSLCFLLTAFSIIIVILYCFKFGREESVEWILACLLSLILSLFVIEPIKALVIAVYVLATVKNVEQDEDDDYINIEPSIDNSNEKIKDVKFKPISGFALVQAKEEGKKIHRMNIMLRQFFAYIFYLWLVMAVVYINFSYNTFLLHEKVQHSFSETNSPDYVNYNNITDIDQFWDWTENVLPEVLHLQESNTNEEHGQLLGVARLRLIRSKEVRCGATTAANRYGAGSLTDRTCYGDNGYEEDTVDYGERWNDSSYNRSWKYQYASELGGSYKIGLTGTYGGGGYPQLLGTTKLQTVAILTDLKDKGWIDLRTRAVIVECSIYSPGTDLTAMVALLIEFPLTGGVMTSFEIQSQKLLWFKENYVSPLMVLECILLLVVIYSAIHIVCRIREYKKIYFKDLWNWYEMLTTLMTIVSIGMYLGCVIQATNTFNTYLENQSSFTNFEHVVYVHTGMRYLNAWILFLLMFKVVKQLRFIRFLHVYEKTLSKAVGLLLSTGLIFVILLLIYAQVGNLMYGRLLPEFQTVGHSIDTLIVIIRGTFDFLPMLDHHAAFSHFYLYSYYAFAYGIMIALVIAILNDMYRTTKSQMYFKSTLEMQDYEMIDFMMKRFKIWAGFQKPKPAFRRVRFPGLPSISSRSSSSYSNRSSDSLHSAQPISGPEFSQVQLLNMMDRIGPTWQAVLKRFEKIEALEKEEEDLVRKAENEMKDLNWKCRINQLEKEHKELLSWQKPGDSKKSAISNAKQRQSILKKLAKDNQADRKAPATVTGASRTSNTPPTKENKVLPGRRPLSDQGARLDQQPRRGSSSERSKIQSFFKSVKPSKPAWDK